MSFAPSESRRSIAERVGSALGRGNLRQRPGPCDLDTIGALGLVGITERLADAVFRLKYSLDAKTYPDALIGVYGLARALDARHRWRLKRRRIRWMARRVLDYWLSDICRRCTGVRYEVVAGSPHLSDHVCQDCGGSGKRKMPWLRKLPRAPEGRVRATKARVEKHKKVCRLLSDAMDRHRHLLCELERLERVIGDKVVAKLAREARSL